MAGRPEPRAPRVDDPSVTVGPSDGSNPPGGAAADVPTYGAAFWIGLVVGGAVMAYALRGAAEAFSPDGQLGLARWVVGSAVLHDAVLAPIVTIIGIGLAWALPRTVRGPVLAALAISAVVVLFSWPGLRAFGRREANPTLLPHDQLRGVALVLVGVWIVAAAVVAVRLVRDRRR